MRVTTNAQRASEVRLAPRLSSKSATAIVLCALAVVFVIDRATGLAPFQHLYYLPIIVASVRFGYAGSVATAAVVIVLYHWANPHMITFSYEESDVVQIALFVAIGAISAKLANDARRLRQLATTDDLTGLHNLRSFETHLQNLVRQSRGRSPLAVLALDVDNLKSINDVHGHLAGADSVRTVGHVIACCLPRRAIACRYGGDEFVIAVPRCSEADALRIAEDLRHAVATTTPVLAGALFPASTLSVSIGVVSRELPAVRDAGNDNADVAAGERLFRAADGALYAAKAAGRNRVSAAPAVILGARVGSAARGGVAEVEQSSTPS